MALAFPPGEDGVGNGKAEELEEREDGREGGEEFGRAVVIDLDEGPMDGDGERLFGSGNGGRSRGRDAGNGGRFEQGNCGKLAERGEEENDGQGDLPDGQAGGGGEAG